MGLHWGAAPLRALISDEAWNNIQSVQVDPNEAAKPNDTLKFLNARTGQQVGGATVDLFYRLRRSKLREMLSEDVNVVYKKRFTGATFEEDNCFVTAQFDDGTSARGRLLVGADGAHSAVRRTLLPEGSDGYLNQQLPFCATFVQASFNREQALFLRSFHQLYLAGVHPAGQFCFFGMHNADEAERPETWIFFFYISWPSSLQEQAATATWSDAQRLQQLKSFARDYSDPWKSAFEWVPEDHPVWYTTLGDWDPESHPWSNHGGLATLIGDAAHTMTYQRGQGLNHSITDAAKLVDVIQSFIEGGQEMQGLAINSFEEEMIARGGAEVRMSTMNTGMLHDWEKAMRSPVMSKQGMRQDGD